MIVRGDRVKDFLDNLRVLPLGVCSQLAYLREVEWCLLGIIMSFLILIDNHCFLENL